MSKNLAKYTRPNLNDIKYDKNIILMLDSNDDNAGSGSEGGLPIGPGPRPPGRKSTEIDEGFEYNPFRTE